MSTTVATDRRSILDSTAEGELSLRIGGLVVTREGKEINVKPRDARLGLGLDKLTSFSQEVGGPLGEYLYNSFFGHRDPRDPSTLHGAWRTSFPALRCTLALGSDGNESVSLSGYLEPASNEKSVHLSNPTGEMYPGLEHKSPTAGDLLKIANGPARLLEATLLAHLSLRGETSGEFEAPINILDRSSAPSTGSAIEALADLKGHYVRIFRARLDDHNEAVAAGSNATSDVSSLSGMVKSVSDKGVVTIIRIDGQETEIKPDRQIIYHVDHVQIPACWDWSRQGKHSEMLYEDRYISDRFKRGVPIEVNFTERTQDGKGRLSPPSSQSIKGHFWQTLEHEKHGSLIVMRDTEGMLVAIPRRDIRRMETRDVGRSKEWDDRYEVRTVSEKEQQSGAIRFTIGSSGERRIPCSAEWSHTFFGTGWMAPEDLG